MRRRATALLLALVLLACGASARERTISASLVATNAARDGFLSYDSSHQHDIVQAATSLDDGKAKLEDYRKKRAKVVTLFEAAYRALAIAAIETGDPTAIGNLLQAAAVLRDELKALGVTP